MCLDGCICVFACEGRVEGKVCVGVGFLMHVRKGVKSIRMCACCMCRRWVVKVCP